MHVYHGSGVERRGSFVEGVNGDFEKGVCKVLFFMGSGGSLQESDSNMAIFATPTNMERCTASVREAVLSNSLPFIPLCLICAWTLNILITSGTLTP